MSMHQNSPEDLLKHRLLDPMPKVSDSVGPRDFAFLISVQVMLLLLLVWDRTLGTAVLEETPRSWMAGLQGMYLL